MRVSTAVAAIVASVTLVAAVAAGADSPTFGVNAQRSRAVQDSLYGATTDYPDVNPSTVLAPAALRAANSVGQTDSFSVPAVQGDVAYQYAYDPNEDAPTPRDSANEAFLYALDLSSMRNTWGGSAWAFHASDQQCGALGATGQTTTPNLASVASPTVAPGPNGQQFIAVGTGCYLYYAPIGSVAPPASGQLLDASNSSLWSHVKIHGVSEPQCTVAAAASCHQQIDMAPIITPALSVTYPANPTDPLGSPVTVATPVACVGAWNQGLACQALAPPPPGTEQPAPLQWTIPQGGTYTDGGEAILTSSPAWDPQASVAGSNGTIVFGIDDGTKNGAVVFLDPVSGSYKIVPLPGAAGVSSSPAVYEYSPAAVPDGTVFVPDNYGDLYQVAPPGTASGGTIGVVTHAMTDPHIAERCPSSPWDISDIAVGRENVYAVEDCLSAAYEVDVSTLASKGAFSTLNGLSGAFSPSVVRNPNDPSAAFMFVNSNGGGGQGRLYLYNVGQGSSPGDWVQALLADTGAPAYVAPVPDAGSKHALILWSNANGGGFNYWVPSTSPTALTLSGPTTVQSGQTATYTITTNAPPLALCDTTGAWTCTTLLADGRQVAVNTSGGGVSLQSETPTSATWTARVTFTVTSTTTEALEATMQTTADYLSPRTQPLYQSNTLDVTVTPAVGSGPTPCTPSSQGWNTPANCGAPAAQPASATLAGTLTMAVGDQGSSYSPVADPNWTASTGTPDPCLTPGPTCNSPWMGYHADQFALFGQHLKVRVTPPQPVAAPPVLSAPPPSSYQPGICSIYLPPSDQDFVTLPQGVSEATGQPWPVEWDPLTSNGSALSGTVLVDWAWWPPEPPGTVVGPRSLVSRWVADVSRWEYERKAHTSGGSSGKPVTTYTWAPSCVSQGLQGGETDPKVNPAQGGQVDVWGDRIILLTRTVDQQKWGLP